MKKTIGLALLAALCGCCNVKITQDAGRDVIEADNSSWRLFGIFAIASGDPEYPNRDVCVWFCDSLLLDVNMMLLDDAMHKNGYRGLRNISTYKTRENVLLFFNRQKLSTTAELIR